jgi:hypothetical protein
MDWALQDLVEKKIVSLSVAREKARQPDLLN